MKLRIILIGVLLLVLVGSLTAWQLLTPEVVGFAPEAGQSSLPKNTAIEITFSREMRPASVTENLNITPQMEGTFSWEGHTLRFTPAENWPAGVEIQVQLEQGARSRLGLAIRDDTAWSFQIEPVLLAYLWPASDQAEIYVIDPDSGQTTQLTQAGGVLSFSIGADGRMIYFAANNGLGGSDLFSLDRFSGEEQRLLSCQRATCSTITLSAQGDKLAYLRSESQVWVLELEGSGEPVQVSPEGHEVRAPLWSPAGRLSYYDITDMAYVFVDLASGDTASWPNQSGETASWGPGGTAFIAAETYVSETDILRGPTGELDNQKVDESELEPVRVLSSHLLVYQPDGGQVIDLSDDPLAEDFSPAFSPDGKYLAFTRRYLDEERWTPGRQVWLLALPSGLASAGQSAPLTYTPDYKYTQLVWNPDSTMLAVVRFDNILLTEPPEIWLLGLNGGAEQLVVGGYDPQWIP